MSSWIYIYVNSEMKKLWNMKVIVIPIVIRMLTAILKKLTKRKGWKDWKSFKKRIESIQTITPLKTKY